MLASVVPLLAAQVQAAQRDIPANTDAMLDDFPLALVGLFKAMTLSEPCRVWAPIVYRTGNERDTGIFDEVPAVSTSSSRPGASA